MCLTFIDYSDSFDSVSHKFLDRSLAKVGASRKTREMFRTIYAAARGMTRVRARAKRQDDLPAKVSKYAEEVSYKEISSPLSFLSWQWNRFSDHEAG